MLQKYQGQERNKEIEEHFYDKTWQLNAMQDPL